MKQNYSPALYRQIASLRLNEFITVSNKKGINTTIHVTSIVDLDWPQLQLLVPEGSDRFTKRYLLYKWYSKPSHTIRPPMKGEALTLAEADEICRYINIYKDYQLIEHFDINEYISSNSLWDQLSYDKILK